MKALALAVAMTLSLTACGEAMLGSDESLPEDGAVSAPSGGAADAQDETSAVEDPMVAALRELLDTGTVPQDTPEPLLPDKDPETLVADLTSLEFTSMCEPYVKNAVSAAYNAVGLCALRGLSAAVDTGSDDIQEYQAACDSAFAACEQEAAERDALAANVACQSANECVATVGEIDTCNASLVRLDSAILMPAAAWPIPSCAELTPDIGAPLEAELKQTLLATYRELNLGSVVEACQPAHSKCPHIAVPLPVGDK